MLVRSVLYVSATALLGCSRVTSLASCLFLHPGTLGMTARTGAPRFASRSTRPRRLSSSRSRRKAMATPRANPASNPRAPSRIMFGLTGSLGRPAGSTSCGGFSLEGSRLDNVWFALLNSCWAAARFASRSLIVCRMEPVGVPFNVAVSSLAIQLLMLAL